MLTPRPLDDLPLEQQVRLLERRLQRSEQARHEAESMTERRARELDRSNRELRVREEDLREQLALGDRHLLSAQRTAKIATVYCARGKQFVFSPEYGNLLGVPPGQSADFTNLRLAMHPLDRKRVEQSKFEFEVLALANSDHSYEHRIIRLSDRAVRWLRWTFRREADERGRQLSVFGTVQDITEQREASRRAKALRLIADRRVVALSKFAEELKRSNIEAEQANRHKSQFLAMMSHDIRTPMNGILGMLETLSNTPLDESQRRQLDLARASGQRLNVLLNDIIEIVRAESGKIKLHPEPVDLRRTVYGSFAFWEEVNTNGAVRLFCDVDDELPKMVMLDPTRIRQLIDNFVSNALKYTERGEIHIAARKVGPFMRIEVRDTGPGIGAEQQQHLFKDFSRPSPINSTAGQSAGLGLAICKRLVLAMDGQVGVESDIGTGSCFWAEIPLLKVTVFMEKRLSERKNTNASRDLSGSRILIAEDIETNRVVLSVMLDQLGCRLTMVENGKAAVDAVQSGDFDFVLMDVNMPVMDGREATQRIRRLAGSQARVPIIGVTANVLHKDKEDLLAAGMDALVTKPVSVDALKEAMVEVSASRSADAPEQPTPDSPADLPLIDQEMSGLLFDALPEDRRSRVVAAALKDIATLGEELSLACKTGDTQAIKRATHSLKGVAGNIGAVRLATRLHDCTGLAQTELDALVADTLAGIRQHFGLTESPASGQ